MIEERMALVIGKTIKEARQQLGYSQQELANKAYMNKSTIASYETGRRIPDIYSLIYISSILDISVHELVEKMIAGEDEHMKTILVDSIIYDIYMILHTYPREQQRALLKGLNILIGKS